MIFQYIQPLMSWMFGARKTATSSSIVRNFVYRYAVTSLCFTGITFYLATLNEVLFLALLFFPNNLKILDCNWAPVPRQRRCRSLNRTKIDPDHVIPLITLIITHELIAKEAQRVLKITSEYQSLTGIIQRTSFLCSSLYYNAITPF